MRTAAIISVMLGMCLSTAWAAPGAVSSLSIQVTVTNETSGAPAVDAEVALTVYQDNKPIEERTAAADAEGSCVFKDVPAGPGIAAVATAKHQEMMFGGRPISLEHLHDDLQHLHVTVYDVSTDTSVLSIGTHHMVIRVDPQGLFVDEYLQIVNDSDFAVTSGQKSPDGRPIVLKVYLPAGFKDVKYTQYFEEHAIILSEDGFVDTMAVPPGRHDAVITYALEIDAPSLKIIKKAGLPTQDFMVFAQLKGASIEGLNEPLGQMTLNNGSPADYFALGSLDSGEQIGLQITGLNVQQNQNDLWTMFGIIFGVIVAAGILRIWIQKKPQTLPADSDDTT
jgi:hypothetical protein